METYKPLSDCEKEVLELFAKDLTTKLVADRLIKSKHTPKNHLANAKKKLKTHTLSGTITRAHQLRQINLDDIEIE